MSDPQFNLANSANSRGLAIRGLGWVTPLGCEPEALWGELMRGSKGKAEPVAGAPPQPGGRVPWYLPVPLKPFDSLGRIARIRRSSAISYFSVAAGLDALGIKEGKLAALEPALASTTAVIFAICSGGIHYTRRFYEKVVAEGAQAASPLLFPETVYNAPASHLSAMLGIDGASYTVVGDSTVGIAALAFAEELLACDPQLEQCVIVGAEECDWILWEGYHTWRLLSSQPEAVLHHGSAGHAGGMLLAEGGAAIVVGRSRGESGEVALASMATAPYFKQEEAADALAATLQSVSPEGSRFVVGSANGTWVDASEATALDAVLGDAVVAGRAGAAPRYYPKASLGDALGASALWQIGVAATALAREELPGTASGALAGAQKATVTVIGLNQQVAAATLVRHG